MFDQMSNSKVAIHRLGILREGQKLPFQWSIPVECETITGVIATHTRDITVPKPTKNQPTTYGAFHAKQIGLLHLSSTPLGDGFCSFALHVGDQFSAYNLEGLPSFLFELEGAAYSGPSYQPLEVRLTPKNSIIDGFYEDFGTIDTLPYSQYIVTIYFYYKTLEK